MASDQPADETGSTSIFRQLFTMLAMAVVVATIFTAWTPVGLVASSLSGTIRSEDEFEYVPPGSEDVIPTPTARPRPQLGIVAGHWGNDSGAVCPDELTEVDVNLTIATLVREQLIAQGFDVDLLKEFDSRLLGYRALALVSIHADSCEYVNDLASGFKVSAAISSANPEKAARLAACIRSRYAETTGLNFHSGSITADMTSYHAFEEIHYETTAVIIETGFLNLDRRILTQYPNVIAEGISRGVLCFIYNEDAS